jgi:2-oxoglutarate dehydrogenase E1 component
LTHVAIVRLERLYPFPKAQLRKALSAYANAREFIWCQEEPQNQGAWFSSQHHMRAALAHPELLQYAGRAFSAAPAPGYAGLHVKQQRALVAQALGLQMDEQ